MLTLIYDIETYPNCFTLAAEDADSPLRWCFEISEFRSLSMVVIGASASMTRRRDGNVASRRHGLGRRVPSHDGLGGTVDSENGT